jgi:tetratricopeptide (TPR) repeat protein
MKRIGSVTMVFLLLFTGPLMAQTKKMRTGNRLYEEKKYKEAATAYQQALSKNPGYVPGMFNLGNALYQQKNLEAARQVMGTAAKQAKDKTLKSNANYNIGNTYMQEQKWQEAIDTYKRALKNDPQDEAAKYNLSYALAMMKKQQGGGGKNNEKNKDQKQNEQNKDKQESEDKNNNKQDQKQDKQQGEEDKQEKEKPQPQESKLSEKQAEQLLNALAQEEKKLHDKKEKGKAVKIKVEKDW